jgi:para-aminobenzoate synthetase component 1
MQRAEVRFSIKDISQFKNQILNWAQQFESVLWLDSNGHHEKYSQYEAVLAFGEETTLVSDATNSFEKIKKFQSETKDYLFGYLSYDLKNDVEILQSNNFDGLKFPDMCFFQPKKIIFIQGNTITFKYLPKYKSEINTDYDEISIANTEVSSKPENINIQSRIEQNEYLDKVQKVLDHIYRGDIYEANFCQEFYAEESSINPVEAYKNLNSISKPPFATFFKYDNHYLLSASPERYLKKIGSKIISQPIKGTARRSNSLSKDKELKTELQADPKEQAENVMIVDLVRNDLSRQAIKGSVKVEELCKVYSFKQVHQMISTVSSEITDDIHPVDIIKNSYPMGSMTGAPKIAAMEIIEALEETKRGLYSGTVGYFTPDGDFDFNVIIRSILYNAKEKYVSFSVGSAITSLSIPEKELEECLLKAKAMRQVLLSTI